ncbi:MAG: ABC transporter ATP-binding protein, partial [Clostridia bacterium]|nr:ABC transporter ATP-binding protein [Clostridia bacterium]
MLKRFLKYYIPHKKLFALDMLASLMVSVIGIVYPIVTRKMLNTFIPDREYRLIVISGILLLAIYLVRTGLRYFIQYQGHIMGTRMQAEMRSDMFNHLESLPYSFYDENETGKIMSRMTTDLFDISELAHHGPENAIIASITLLVSVIYLMTINVWLALIILLALPLLVGIVILIRGGMRKAFKRTKEALATINGKIESSISGIRVTKAFTNDRKETEKFEEGNKEFVGARSESYKYMAAFFSSSQFVTDLFNVIVLIAGGLFLYAGRIDFADYSAFIVSVALFLTPLNMLIQFAEMLEEGASGFERFCEIMDTYPETDAEDAEDAGVLKGDIEFKDVSYSYLENLKLYGIEASEDEEQNVLSDVSFKINSGETYALVGPSGGGKTTICHLIPHFYDVLDGQILLDGKDINKLTRASVRRNIGIVQQDVYLFNASIKENILYGKLDATDEEVIEAAKRANIHEFVMSMPNGYDTEIGERGIRLSGGQKQRLSIARVFLKNPSILILDEATSA